MGGDNGNRYKKDSLTLTGAVAMGTGVMIGAGIFALTGQIAELAGTWFPLAFLAAAVVAAFSAYSYIKLSNAYPSAGGIAMYLKKAYGEGLMTGACALLMYFSMVINESLVARTFGTYTLQLFGAEQAAWLTPALGVGVIAFAYGVNLMGNTFIERFSFFMAFVKIAGLLLLAFGGMWAAGFRFESISAAPQQTGAGSFLGAVALGLLAFKGFTTITNSGDELKNPKKNVGRAIIISVGLCLLLYLLVAFAVGGNLSISEIVEARDYSLSRAAEPAFGQVGVWITVGFAITATVSGLIASVFAVSRMLAMLTEMGLAPYGDLGIPGNRQRHTLVYTVVLAALLTLFFDLGRIAALGAVFYIVMDMAIHAGIWKNLRRDLEAKTWVLLTAFVLDAVILGALLYVKARNDPWLVAISLGGLILVFAGEKGFMHAKTS